VPRPSIAHEGIVPWDRTAPVVPFIHNVMQSDVYKWSKDVEWRSVPTNFKSAMEITGYEYGQSSIAVRLKATDGANYRMMVSDLFDILEKSQVVNDQIPEHEYKFAKQGNSYMIKVLL
jgi:hypothetical protein